MTTETEYLAKKAHRTVDETARYLALRLIADRTADGERLMLAYEEGGHFRRVVARGLTGLDIKRFAAGSDFLPTHQHYKGGLYQMLFRATQESDLRDVVVYRDVAGKVWVRDSVDFFTTLPGDVPRFATIKEQPVVPRPLLQHRARAWLDSTDKPDADETFALISDLLVEIDRQPYLRESLANAAAALETGASWIEDENQRHALKQSAEAAREGRP
ncbi:MAG: DUF1653 domain-containing protein [Reyranella sp.]|nr:DUF1653 domain-containing protein [Reyranella sp.]